LARLTTMWELSIWHKTIHTMNDIGIFLRSVASLIRTPPPCDMPSSILSEFRNSRRAPRRTTATAIKISAGRAARRIIVVLLSLWAALPRPADAGTFAELASCAFPTPAYPQYDIAWFCSLLWILFELRSGVRRHRWSCRRCRNGCRKPERNRQSREIVVSSFPSSLWTQRKNPSAQLSVLFRPLLNEPALFNSRRRVRHSAQLGTALTRVPRRCGTFDLVYPNV
jgi:hypothetical protein